MKNLLQFLAVIMVLLLACKANTEETELIKNYGYSYYPLDSGLTRIYQIDSISFNDNNGKTDTFQFYLMEMNAGSILGQTETNLHTQILRYVSKDTAQENWEPRASIFALQTANNLQIVEDNIRFVKLTFPLGNVVSWNGNMYNSLGRRTFLLQGKDISYAIEDNKKFERCTIVQETNIKNAIEEIFIKSVYAENIGLIAFTNKYINTQNEISSGYFVTQKLIWHNK